MIDRHASPPRLAERLAGRAMVEQDRDARMGDLEERFRYLVRERGASRAGAWYRRQVFSLVILAFLNNTIWSGIMFKNYLRTAFRNIKRCKGYSFINIVGLALGMASCILILLWAKDELATDTYHAKLESLYLIQTISHSGGHPPPNPGTVPALAPALKAEYPEVLNAARFINGQTEHLLSNGDRQFRELVQLADPEIFRMFTFPFVEGRPDDAFGDPYVLVLSERLARKIFEGDQAVGQVLTVNNHEDFRVVGVMKDIPHNSSLRFDVWAPLALNDKWIQPGFNSTWSNHVFRSYVEMAPGADIEAFNQKIFGRIRRANPGNDSEPVLYPFGKVYLEYRGQIATVRLFSLIALAILMIACINFMNLSTARSAQRAREVGLRKVLGARRAQVMRQFFGESLFFSVLSLVLALLLSVLFLPLFRDFTAKPFPMHDLLDPGMILGILAVCLVTGFLSGSYPALFLSSFRPAAVLKSSGATGASAGSFRKALVVFQFSLSVVLIIGATVIFSQMRYVKHKNLGFDRENLLYVRLEGKLPENIFSLKNEILGIPGVESATAATYSPLGIYNNGDGWDWEERAPNLNPQVTYLGVDPDFLKTFKMELARGEPFPPGTGEFTGSVIINQRFADVIGRPDPVGLTLSQPEINLRIVGVVKDFHFMSLTQEIGPVLIFYDPTYKTIDSYKYLFIRFDPESITDTLPQVEKTVKAFNPGFPFDYRFLDNDYDGMYRGMERVMAEIRVFTLLAILISCLGLFGLAAFTAERRTKEIGIRKVMGASDAGLMALLSREYAKWVLAANVIAWPVAYFLMKSWLQDYHYRISLGLPLFLFAAFASILIALLTVSFQALKAARTDPVKSLRYE
jgi:putative ABC transport system permease protein